MKEIPRYALRAYALLHNKFGTDKEFKQDSLNWLVSTPMRKKIFSVLLNSGWIKKKSKTSYLCLSPETIFKGLFSFKVPDILKKAKKDYCYFGASAVEIWTKFSYVQRGWEHSPYFIEVKKGDLGYWKNFLSAKGIPYFLEEGSFLGEFIILKLAEKIDYDNLDGYPVKKLENVVNFCEGNLSLFEYPLAYLVKKYKLKIKMSKEILSRVEEAL